MIDDGSLSRYRNIWNNAANERIHNASQLRRAKSRAALQLKAR